MARISDAELDGLLEIIGEVNHADDLDAYRDAVLDVLARVFAVPIVSYNEVAFDGTPTFSLVRPEQPAEVHALWERFAPQNPLLAHYLDTRDSRAFRWSDVIERAELERLEIFQRLYRPAGIEHQMAMEMLAPDDSLVGIVLSGPDAFTDSQRAMLDLARPHLVQAYTRARRRPSLGSFGLTAREADVLRAMVAGRSTAAIAIELGISARTVHKHTEHIFEKLGVRDRVAAVSVALGGFGLR